MADEADRAQAQVDAFIADSLARAKTAPGPAPDIIDDAQVREAALTEAGKAWLADVDAQIAALRAQRV